MKDVGDDLVATDACSLPLGGRVKEPGHDEFKGRTALETRHPSIAMIKPNARRSPVVVRTIRFIA